MFSFPRETHAEIYGSMLVKIEKTYTRGSLSCFTPSLQTLPYFPLNSFIFSFSFVFLPFTYFPKIEEHICNLLPQCHVIEVFVENKLNLNPPPLLGNSYLDDLYRVIFIPLYLSLPIHKMGDHRHSRGAICEYYVMLWKMAINRILVKLADKQYPQVPK